MNKLWFCIFMAIATSVSAADDTAFLKPPQYVGQPQVLHAVTNRAFQGIPSMAVSPKGRLWATWYAGVTPGEDHNNYVVLSTSGDDGKTWKEVLVVDPDADGPVRTYDPELWMAPDGRLRLVWAQAIAHEGSVAGVWFLEITNPDSDTPKWKKPVRITDGIMMCKPIVLSTGEWVLPASTWRKTDNSARMVVSTDKGKTWSLRGGCNVPVDVRAFDEHMFIERKDHSIWLLVRTKYGIGESVSTDCGKTWPELTPSSIPHPSARFFISRLKSGNLLLVKHGPMTERTGRSHLMAFISKDDGKTWGGGLLLDERNGVSYPDGQQTPDGLIRIIYDYSRTADRHILMATFREEDATAGNDVSGAVRLRQLVSQASGGQEKPKIAPKAVNANSDGEPLRRKSPGQFNADGFQPESLRTGALLFTDRKYVVAELPDALRGAQFLRVPLEGTKTLTCDRAGTVWVLTPAPERNKDSQTKTLLNQGFKKVALPEICLFNPSSTGNFCTLYQRDCAAGETISIGKWAVPVFAVTVTAGSAILPPNWNATIAGDEVMKRLIRVTAPHVKGAHDAEFVCVGDRAYIVEHDNDIQPGHGAGAAQYCVLTVVNLKTLAVEKTVPLTKSGQAFENVSLPVGMCFVPRIIRANEHTLRCYFASQPPKQQAQTWYRDFDLRTQSFENRIHKAKLKTSSGVFDMQPQYFHADAVAHGFTKPAKDNGLYLFDSFKQFGGKTYVAISNYPGKQNALALLHDDLATFEIIGDYNEPQSEQLSESAVNRLPDGTWMAICRNEGSNRNYRFTTSKDGRTWTVGKELPPCAESHKLQTDL